MHNNPTATACGTLMGIISYSLRVTAFHNLESYKTQKRTFLTNMLKFISAFFCQTDFERILNLSRQGSGRV